MSDKIKDGISEIVKRLQANRKDTGKHGKPMSFYDILLLKAKDVKSAKKPEQQIRDAIAQFCRETQPAQPTDLGSQQLNYTKFREMPIEKIFKEVLTNIGGTDKSASSKAKKPFLSGAQQRKIIRDVTDSIDTRITEEIDDIIEVLSKEVSGKAKSYYAELLEKAKASETGKSPEQTVRNAIAHVMYRNKHAVPYNTLVSANADYIIEMVGKTLDNLQERSPIIQDFSSPSRSL